jgi:hypothetical protein
LLSGTVALTLLEALAGLAHWPVLDDVRAVGAGGVLLLAMSMARWQWVALATGFVTVGVVAVALSEVPGSPYAVYRSGMATVAPVVAVLVTVSWLNAVVLAGRYNEALAAMLVGKGRESWSRGLPLVLAYLLAPVLLAGALAQAYGPFQHDGDDAHNEMLLAVAVRSMSLALLWTPMGAPAAFALTLLDAPVVAYLSIAVPTSLVGLLLVVVSFRRTAGGFAPDPDAVADPARVRRLVLFLGSLPCLVAVLAALRGELSVHVVLLALVTVTVAWATTDWAAVRRRTGGRAVRGGGLASEGVALYLSLGVFVGGIRLVTSGGLVGWVTGPAAAVTLAFIGSAVCFLVGVHPVAVIAVLAPTIMALDPAYAAVGAFALCAGAQSVNVSSPFSPLSVVGSQLVGRSPWSVSAPVHWRFSVQQFLLYGAACALGLWFTSPS